jgi:hypothetical protein
MRRAISLRKCPKIKEGQRMIALKGSTHPTKSRVRINPRTIYPFANASGTKQDDCGMREKESQGESRTWENCISGLVYEVKAIPLVGTAFTLIERTPSKGCFSLSVASTDSANFPVQADSPASALFRATGIESGVTKSRDGKSAVYDREYPVPKALPGNLKRTDCRISKCGHDGGLSASQIVKTNMQAVG